MRLNRLEVNVIVQCDRIDRDRQASSFLEFHPVSHSFVRWGSALATKIKITPVVQIKLVQIKQRISRVLWHKVLV